MISNEFILQLGCILVSFIFLIYAILFLVGLLVIQFYTVICYVYSISLKFCVYSKFLAYFIFKCYSKNYECAYWNTCFMNFM